MRRTDLKLANGGSPIRLGAEIARGGEGAITAVQGRGDLVAKIYLATPGERKIHKLRSMVGCSSAQMLKIAAWPLDLIVDNTATVRGFVMPRVADRLDIHQLYSPKSRANAFPEADFRFLAHTAGNVARAFAVVHDQGHIVGDVNHSNVLVGRDATVMLIDCDSFQVRAGSQVFTCDVGVPLFTPPELQGRSLRDCIRNKSHDDFGLALLLFHLLFMGRHPFAGRYSGRGEMPIEKAIAEYRFAYGSSRATYRMDRPPGALPLDAMGPRLAAHFGAAFEPPRPGRARPDPASWLAALDSLERNLQVCSTASWHQYPTGTRSCPWCEMESHTGVRLFGLAYRPATGGGAIDVAALWLAIEEVQGPGADPALPSSRPWAPPSGMELPDVTSKRVRQGLCIGLVGAGTIVAAMLLPIGLLGLTLALIVAVVLWPKVPRERREAATRAHAAAVAAWQSTLDRWARETQEVQFRQARQRLEAAYHEISALPDERRRRMATLAAQAETRQLHRFLDRHRIDREAIQGIGASRAATLASYGIETAADVDYDKILSIPGLGPVSATRLREWQRGHIRRFRFNSNKPVDPRDINSLDGEIEARRQSLLTTLGQGPAVLRRTSQEIIAARERLMPLLEDTWSALKVAEICKARL